MRTFASRDPSYNEKRDVRDAEVGQEGHSAAYFEDVSLLAFSNGSFWSRR
jgi:hypothetical protein